MRFLLTLILLFSAVQGCLSKKSPQLMAMLPLTSASAVVSTVGQLSNLVLSAGSLSPAFSANTTSYTMNVAFNTASTTVTPAVSSSSTSITVNGVSVASGSASSAIALTAGGTTTITIITTDQDGTTKTYTIAITRSIGNDNNLTNLAASAGSLSPVFASGTTAYTISVPYTTSTSTATPTVSDPLATVTVNGVTVASGSASSAIALTAGGTTNITVVVTAQDSTTKTYTIGITRTAASTNNNLSALTVSVGTLSPVFASGTTSYTVQETTTTSSVTFTPTLSDALSTMTLNGTSIASGAVSGSIALTVGTATTVTIIVTAQSGATKTYTISVIRVNPDLRVFTTNTLYNGNLGGKAGADTKCNADGNKPATGTYKALVVDTSTRVACINANCSPVDPADATDWVFKAYTPYYRASDSALVFTTDGSGRFTFGTLTNSFGSSGSSYWTGMSSAGGWKTSGGGVNTCSGWTSTAGNGDIGDSTTNDYTSLHLGAATCTTTYRILCVEQ